jgi:hypothetical protein
MKNNALPWPKLYESEDRARVTMLATCLAAMEFDVELGCRCRAHRCGEGDGCAGPFVLRVPRRDLAHLREVLEEIIEEQEEFDVFVDCFNRSARQHERRLILALVVIVGALATVGAIEV